MPRSTPNLTLSAISRGIRPQSAAIVYLGVLQAWNDYLAHDNKGRGVVLIGHSQGASLLIALIKREIDPSPTERQLLVSAVLMGGNVTVPTGRNVGGDFAHISACQTNAQTQCVLAYSSFNSPPPANSFFGRVGTSIGAISGLAPTSAAGLQVLCTNPAGLTGGVGSLDPYFPDHAVSRALALASNTAAPRNVQVRTPWVSYPSLYSAKCQSSAGATWLQVTDIAGPKQILPTCSLCSDLGGDSILMTSILPWAIWSKWCETNRSPTSTEGVSTPPAGWLTVNHGNATRLCRLSVDPG